MKTHTHLEQCLYNLCKRQSLYRNTTPLLDRIYPASLRALFEQYLTEFQLLCLSRFANFPVDLGLRHFLIISSMLDEGGRLEFARQDIYWIDEDLNPEVRANLCVTIAGSTTYGGMDKTLICALHAMLNPRQFVLTANGFPAVPMALLVESWSEQTSRSIKNESQL